MLAILSDPDRQNRYLATAQVGITMASLGLGMYGEHAVAEWLIHPLERLSWLAEPTGPHHRHDSGHRPPDLPARRRGRDGAQVVGYPACRGYRAAPRRAHAARERLFSPVVVVLNGIGNAIVRLMGVPPADSHERLFSAAELEIIVEESAERGLIEPVEQLFIENIFDLRERTVGQIMTPRNHIVGIPVTAPEEEVLSLVCEGCHSALSGLRRRPGWDRRYVACQGLTLAVGLLTSASDLTCNIPTIPSRSPS